MHSTSSSHPAPAQLTQIGGLHHLLARNGRGDESVVAYSADEMGELFSPEEQALLALGGPVDATDSRGHVLHWVDMVAAARAAG